MDGTGRVIPLTDRQGERGRARLAALAGGHLEVAATGALVYDETGLPYLDCGGQGGFLLGHRHPAVTRAVLDQVNRRPMASRVLLDPTVARAAATLAEVTPPGLDFVHFVNSATEAVEAAIKLARAHGAYRLVSATGGSHGTTLGALSLSTRGRAAEPFRPLLPSVSQVPYGDLAALTGVLAAGGRQCVVLEAVQADNGVVVPPAGYLSGVAAACRTHGAFLVLDETTTGLGRLGRWWGASAEELEPDVLCVGGALSGGVVPVAAIAATSRAYAPLAHESFGVSETFAAAPIAMAAATAAVLAIRDERLVERAALLGTGIRTDLRRMLADHPAIREVRGAGLLIGIELADRALAERFGMELLDRQVLTSIAPAAPSVLRLAPPAVLTDDQLGWLLLAVSGAATALGGAPDETGNPVARVKIAESVEAVVPEAIPTKG
jgi:putrescine aminotransferase